MNLKFFADHGISNFIIDGLREAGYEVFRLRDFIPKDSPDSQVIAEAQRLESILISLNGAFADIVTYPPARHNGIVSLQARNHPEIFPQLLERSKEFFSQHAEMSFFKGKLLIIEVDRIRIRE